MLKWIYDWETNFHSRLLTWLGSLFPSWWSIPTQSWGVYLEKYPYYIFSYHSTQRSLRTFSDDSMSCTVLGLFNYHRDVLDVIKKKTMTRSNYQNFDWQKKKRRSTTRYGLNNSGHVPTPGTGYSPVTLCSPFICNICLNTSNATIGW